ncbi:MAG: DUF4115 domain-containing protein [Anaerovibrio sp.]|uniref:helix-turn-helix domain-containing protein n=1 Tax=Anaerovibrio sp. TaxID=1872532 RepID=UPI0025D9BA75|nr:RodZ domain-containing protein [Anaerovibrio sp.]MCR5175975.1 DUF4115 domain-containing protein [Anaerovibrio sp.]
MLGDTLRREREKQGLTVKDIENETSIRSVYITAIEKGDYDSLPGDVYTKGFIRNYARALNIDGDSLLRQYNSERNISSPVQPVDLVDHEEYEDSVPQRTVTVKESSRNHSGPEEKSNLFSSGTDYRERTEDKSGYKKFLALLAVLAVFLGGVYYAFSDNPEDSTRSTVKNEQTKKTAEKPKAAPVEKPAAKKFNDVNVTAKFNDSCWVSVEIDGKNVLEGTIEKGKEISWKGKDSVKLLAGNAGAVELTWNENNLGIIGGKGQVVERFMTKDSDGAAGNDKKTGNDDEKPNAKDKKSRM